VLLEIFGTSDNRKDSNISPFDFGRQSIETQNMFSVPNWGNATAAGGILGETLGAEALIPPTAVTQRLRNCSAGAKIEFNGR